MPPLFWIDIAGLCISILVTGSLTLLVMGVDPKNPVNFSFGLFTGIIAVWTISALFLRLSLWLEPILPTAIFLINTNFWLRLATIFIALTCIFSLMFTVTFLGRRTRWSDLALTFGFLVVIALLVLSLVAKGSVIRYAQLDENGLVQHGKSSLTWLALGLWCSYIVWSLILFWQERHRNGAFYLALGMLILVLSLILRGAIYAPFPFLSFSNATCAFILAYGVISKQILNPLRARTIELNKEIEERKEAEDKLRTAEEKYRGIFENAVEGVFQATLGGAFITTNPALAQMLGYETPEDLTRNISDIERQLYVKPERRMEFIRALQENNTVKAFEAELYRKDGNTALISINARTIKNEDGQILHLEGFVQDVTERKQYENGLRNSQERLAQIINFLPDPTFVIDTEGCVIAWNKAMEKLTEVKAEDMTGRGNYEYSIPFYGTRRPVLIDLTTRWDEETAKTYKFVTKEGDTLISETLNPPFRQEESLFWNAARPLYSVSGDVIGAIEVIRDITHIMKAEKALKESEEKYRSILASIREGYSEVDLAGNFTFLNDRECELLGYSRDELLGMNIQSVTTAETAELMYRTSKEMLSSGKGELLADYEIIRKDGSKRIHELSTSLIRDASGEPVGVRGVARDITDIREGEIERKRLEEQLQNAQKMKALGTLAGGIAHDFNNLLMGIQGRSSLILLNTDPSHPHFKHLRSIEEYIRSAANLTSQLLGFARGGKYEARAADLNKIVKKSLEMFGRIRKELRIHSEYLEDTWTVEVDQGQIEQVLLNLYVNASQAMPAGGDLYIRPENIILDEDYVRPYQVRSGKYVKISVTDSGVGMDEATLKRIFEPFFTTKEMGRGIGLGLASVYGIVKNHDGIINAYSEKGKGTTFNIYLPASEEEVVEEEVLPEEVLRGTETILLVDDEKIIIDSCKDVLEALGYQVLVARRGEEAIDVYENNKDKIDMVILDMIMPGMSGGETHDRLKDINPEVSVLLSSGYSINGQAMEIMNRGCNGFIQKPFNLKQLSQKIREILDKK